MSSLEPGCSAAEEVFPQPPKKTRPSSKTRKSTTFKNCSAPGAHYSVSALSVAQLVVYFGLLALMKLADAAPRPATLTSGTQTTQEESLIVLFEDSEFKGIRSRLHVGHLTCINLIGKLNDFFSSVDTMGGCYLLCEHRNCRGRCERVVGRVADLSSVKLNDHVSSLQICGEEDANSGEAEEDNEIPQKSPTNLSPPIFSKRSRRSRRSVNPFSSIVRRRTEATLSAEVVQAPNEVEDDDDQSDPVSATVKSSNSFLIRTPWSDRRRRRRRRSLKEVEGESHQPRPFRRIPRRHRRKREWDLAVVRTSI